MRRFGVLFFAVNLALISCRVAVASTWTGGTNANWSNGANWSGGEPNSTSTALFNAGFPNGTTTPLLIDTTGLQVLNLNFDTFGFYDGVTADTGYTIGTSGGNPLTIANGGTVSLLNTFDGTDITESINAPLTLAGGTITFDNAASLASGDVLSFGGTIGASAGTTLTLAGPGKGVINGAITNGSSGLNLNITGGVWTLNGANTYSGTTTFSDSVVTLTGSDTSLANNGLLNGGGINYFTYAPSGSGSATQVVHSVNGSNIQNIYVLNPGTTSSATLNFQSISEGHENDYVILGGASSTAKIQFGQPTTTFFNTGSYYGTSLASPSSSYVAYDATLGSFRAINYGVDAGSALSPGGATIASGATVAGGGSIGSSTYVQTTGAITAQTSTTIHTLTIDGGYDFTLGSGQTLTLNDGGLLKTGGNAATISGGTVTSGGATPLVVHTDEAGDVLTISSAIGSSETGGITKEGYGELILSGTNSYSGGNYLIDGTLDITGNDSGVSGATTLTGGTLDIGSSTALGSGILTLVGYPSFTANLDNTSGGTLVLSNGLSLTTSTTLNFLGSSNLTFNGAVSLPAGTVPVLNIEKGTLTLGGNMASTNGGLTVTGPGTLVLAGTEDYTGTTTINSGNLEITGNAGAGTISFLSAGGGVNTLTYAPTAGGTQQVTNVGGGALRNTFVVNAAGGSTVLNFPAINNASENDYVILGGASSTAKIQFGQPTTTFFNTVSYYGTSLASPSSSYVAYDATLGSFRAINYGVDAGSALSPGGATIASGATVAGGGSIGSSTYVQTTGAITAQTTTSINTLTIDGGYNFTLGSGQVLTLNDGGLLKTGGNSATMSGGTLTTGGSKSLTIHTDEASDVMTISSAIGSMSGGITKQGAGTLVLNGTSTYSGATTITNGTLDITGNSSGAGGTYNVEDGTLQIGTGGSVASTAAVTLGDSTLNGTLVLGDSSGAVSATIANLSVLGSSTGTGNAVVNGNTADSSASTLTVNNATMDIYTGVLGGSGTNNNNLNLTKSGAGTLDLTGVNTYTGTTSVQNGIVQIGGSAGSLSSSTAVVLGSGSNSGILQLGDGTAAVNQTVSSLTTSGSGSANAVVGGYTGNSTLTVNNNSDDSYTGVIGGAGPNYNNVALVKSGTGTLTLGGANTYTGGTTVTAGKLAVNGSVAGNVAAQGGAEVGGSGSIGGTISGAGAVGPGNSPGILSAASVNPSAGTSFNFEFTLNGAPTYGSSTASGNDVLHLEGGSPFTAALTAGNVINLYFAGAGSYLGGFFVNGSDNLSANIANATFNYYIADATGAISYNGNNYELTSGTESTIAAVNAAFADGTVSGYTEEFTASAVPEPSTYVLMFGGLFLLGLRLRRKASLLE
jgi:fibronectin-binding autotransporter adhesin